MRVPAVPTLPSTGCTSVLDLGHWCDALSLSFQLHFPGSDFELTDPAVLSTCSWPPLPAPGCPASSQRPVHHHSPAPPLGTLLSFPPQDLSRGCTREALSSVHRIPPTPLREPLGHVLSQWASVPLCPGVTLVTCICANTDGDPPLC